MNFAAARYFLIFFAVSVIAWIYETSEMYFRTGALVDRGFFYGPYLPIFGVGFLVVLFLVKNIFTNRNKSNLSLWHPMLVFILTAGVGTIIELVVGATLHQVFGLRLWDYSGVPYSFGGYICLETSVFFGAAGLLMLYVIYPLIERMIDWLPKRKVKILANLLVIAIACDFMLVLATMS